MAAWERENTVEKHGKSEYSAEEFGTTDEDLRKPFGTYVQRYKELLG